MAEAGLAGYEAYSWAGVLAPGGTPREIVAKLSADIGQSLSRIAGPGGLEFEVLDADPRRVKRLRVHRRAPAADSETGEVPPPVSRPESAAAE